MNKRKLTTIVVSVLAVAILAVGSTLAYFTSNDTAKNTFTMGNVAITLQETDKVVSGNPDFTGWDDQTSSGLDYQTILPGDTLTKYAQVTVADTSADCYVRVHMVIKFAETMTNQTDKDALTAAIKAEAANYNFVEGTDGYYYYKNSTDCIAHATDELIFLQSIEIPTTIGNDSANQGFSIELTADAIQARNVTFGDTTNAFFANYSTSSVTSNAPQP